MMRFVFFALTLIATTSVIHAQSTFAKGVLLTDSSVTTDSSRVAVRLADPFANAEDEWAIRRLLEQPCRFRWSATTPLRQIAKDLSQHVSFRINVRALEEIGLTADATYGHDDPSNRQQSTASNDPFDGSRRTVVTNQPKVVADKWWSSSSQMATTRPATTQSTASQLFFVLDQLDLTINYRSGQWTITTREAAEQALQSRLYDITTLVDVNLVSRRGVPMGAGFETGFGGHHSVPQSRTALTLVESLESHINPETWEALGGPSTMSVIVVEGRSTLAVSTTPRTHWQVESFLNQLNRAK